MDRAPGTILRKKDRAETGDEFIAIKTGPGVAAGAWFVYHPSHGGGYEGALPGGEELWEETGE